MNRDFVLFCVSTLLFASAILARKNNQLFLDETPEDLRDSLRRVGPAQAARLRKHLEKNVVDLGSGHSIDEFAAKSIEALKKLASSATISDELRQAAETIVQLPSTTGRCDYQGYIELATSYLIIGGEPRELLDTKDRLARLVLYYAREHKENCLPKYEQVYEDLVKDLPADSFKTIESFFDDDLVASLVAADPLAAPLKDFKLEDEIFLQKLIAKFETGASVGHLLKQVPVVWPKVFDIIQRQWIDKMLMKQCTDFTFAFKDIFAPLRLDSLTFNGSPATRQASAPFLKHWRLYRVCMAFQQAPESGNHLAESMMDLMYDQQINYHGLK